MALITIEHSTHKTLTPDEVTSVRTTVPCSVFYVTNRHTTADMFIRNDGVDPAPDGDDSLVLLASSSAYFNPGQSPDGTTSEIRLVSSNANPFSVEAY